jgi:hypothetical protein
MSYWSWYLWSVLLRGNTDGNRIHNCDINFCHGTAKRVDRKHLKFCGQDNSLDRFDYGFGNSFSLLTKPENRRNKVIVDKFKLLYSILIAYMLGAVVAGFITIRFQFQVSFMSLLPLSLLYFMTILKQIS